jgi:CubicO group peptidase (beta-lactamase class C family)
MLLCRRQITFALTCLVFLADGAAPAATPTINAGTIAAIDKIVQNALKAWKVPGASLALVYRGRVVRIKGYGVRELGGNQPVTEETLFPLASCTKAFTTTAMAMLVDEGKMAWDDPVRKHVDFFRLSDPLADANVTLRDLVCHRTGLAGHDLLWYRSPWSQEEIIRRIGLVKLSRSFRSGYEYQSIMVMAAGRAVATASKTPWEEVVRKRIFAPLGMARTGCTTVAALKDPNHAAGHRKNRKDAVEVVPWYPMTTPDPAGSINTCARDMSKWLLFQLGDGTFRGQRLVSAKNLAETHLPHTIMHLKDSGRAMQPDTIQMSYGLGWVIQDYRGQLLVSHGGAIDGFRAHVTLVPHAQLGIYLLNNLDATQMNLAISNRIVDLILDLGIKDWNAYLGEVVKKEEAAKKAAVRHRQEKRHQGTKPSLALAAYAGAYENAAYGTAQIRLRNGNLEWEWSSFHGPLQHFHFDTFTARQDFMGDPLMVFRLNANGDVGGMKFLNVEFKKQK